MASKHESGYACISDPGSDRPLQEVATHQCAHCGGVWHAEPGSGKTRGFCMRCNGFICGPGCAECVPQELLVENIEKGRPLDFRPTVVGGNLWMP